MKFSKKLFVGILALALLVSCFAVVSTASDDFTEDNIEDVLEYYLCGEHVVENYDNYGTEDAYVFVSYSECPDCAGELEVAYDIIKGKSGAGKTTTDSGFRCKNTECGWEMPNDNTHTYCPSCLKGTKTVSKSVIDGKNYFVCSACDWTLRYEEGKAEFNRSGDDKNLNGELCYVVTEKDGEKVLKLDNIITGPIQYVYDSETDPCKGYVVNFRVMTEDLEYLDKTAHKGWVGAEGETQPVNGARILVEMKLNTPSNPFALTPTHTMFSMDLNDMANPKFSYIEYGIVEGTTRYSYETKVLDAVTPALGKWYDIELVFDFENGYYDICVKPDGGEAVTVSRVNIATAESMINFKFKIANSNNVYVGHTTYLDDVKFYEGTFQRNLNESDVPTAEALINLDKLYNSTTNIATKVRIADVYNTLLNEINYTTVDSTPNKAKVDEIIANAKSKVISETYVEAFKTYTDMIAGVEGYYARLDHCDLISRFDGIFRVVDNDPELGEIVRDLTSAEILDGRFPGLDADDVTVIENARELYDSELSALEVVKMHSDAFMDIVKGYDPTNKNYNYIMTQYAGIKVFTDRDPVYNYVLKAGEDEEDIVYKNVAEAEAVFVTLEKKVNEILYNISEFSAAVQAMAEEPTILENFGVYYRNYLKASAVFTDGTVHKELDLSTYSGLEEDIALYLVREAYVLDRVAESDQFITYVTNAATSTYYVTIEAELDKAAAYIDDTLENGSVEDEYPGVMDARALYAELRNKLAVDLQNANAYIAKVEAIKSATTFAAKKAAIRDAQALVETGSIIGLEGVKEANMALSLAEAEITALEGYSTTLIATVEALKASSDIAERRELIFVANNCLDKCEATYSGVDLAKSELKTQIDKYNADVASANSTFVSVVNTAAVAMASTSAYKAPAAVVVAIVK